MARSSSSTTSRSAREIKFVCVLRIAVQTGLGSRQLQHLVSPVGARFRWSRSIHSPLLTKGHFLHRIKTLVLMLFPACWMDRFPSLYTLVMEKVASTLSSLMAAETSVPVSTVTRRQQNINSSSTVLCRTVRNVLLLWRTWSYVIKRNCGWKTSTTEDLYVRYTSSNERIPQWSSLWSWRTKEFLFVCFYQSCLSSNDFRLFRFSCTSACRELQNTPALWGEGREEEIVIATVEETLDYNSVKVHI